MKAMDFLDEWNKTHTSSPSFQDVLDWAEKEHTIEMKELNANWIMTLGVQKQTIINKACRWLKENARDYACATIRCYGEEDEIICDVLQEIVEDFRKAMEEEL